MEQNVVQLLTQLTVMQQQLAEGLHATNANLTATYLNLASLMQASERRQEVMLKEARDGRQRSWDDSERFRNCKMFSGKLAEWDEWCERFVGNIKARSPQVCAVLRVIEHKISERELESEQSSQVVEAADPDMPSVEELTDISSKLHHLLGNLTTLDAHAMVRRSRGENGLLAWKKLTLCLNPKTLASGLKAINAVHNPSRITEVRRRMGDQNRAAFG